MADLIDRQALKDALLYDWAFHFPQTEYSERKGYRKRDREVSSVIENLPPVHAEPKTGHWIKIVTEKDGFNEKWHYECSECKCNGSMLGYDHYCPNCGCLMESEV